MMASKENAAASLDKVDQSPLLQHFSTFSLRMYFSVVYWQSCVGGEVKIAFIIARKEIM